MSARPWITIGLVAAGLWAQAPQDRPEADPPAAGEAKTGYTLAEGTKVPLSLINSVSTRHSAEGDRVYLETVFPVLVNGRIVVPVGSYVAGTVTQVKRPGRVKGRGELYVRFDSPVSYTHLTLPTIYSV